MPETASKSESIGLKPKNKYGIAEIKEKTIHARDTISNASDFLMSFKDSTEALRTARFNKLPKIRQ